MKANTAATAALKRLLFNEIVISQNTFFKIYALYFYFSRRCVFIFTCFSKHARLRYIYCFLCVFLVVKNSLY